MDRGEILLKARDAKRMSQEHLAAVSGVSVRTVRRAEKGEAVSGESLRCLCSVLELDATSLPGPASVADLANANEGTSLVERPVREAGESLGRFGDAAFQALACAPYLAVLTAIALVATGGWAGVGAVPLAAVAAQGLLAYAAPTLSRRLDAPAASMALGMAYVYLAVLWLVFLGAGSPKAIQAMEVAQMAAGFALVWLGLRVRLRQDVEAASA